MQAIETNKEESDTQIDSSSSSFSPPSAALAASSSSPQEEEETPQQSNNNNFPNSTSTFDLCYSRSISQVSLNHFEPKTSTLDQKKASSATNQKNGKTKSSSSRSCCSAAEGKGLQPKPKQRVESLDCDTVENKIYFDELRKQTKCVRFFHCFFFVILLSRLVVKTLIVRPSLFPFSSNSNFAGTGSLKESSFSPPPF